MQTKKLDISYSNIEDAIASFLIANSIINDNEDIVEITLPIRTKKDGLVSCTVTTTKIR